MSALTLDATYATATANSYVASVAAANEIASLIAYIPFISFNAIAWNSASDDAKAFALIFAATSIDRLPFVGSRTFQVQALEWPRIDTGRQKWDHIDGSEIIPEEITWAQVIEAAELLSAAAQTAAEQGVLAEQIGDHSVTYDRAHLQKASTNINEPTAELLRRSGLIPTGASSVHIPRG